MERIWIVVGSLLGLSTVGMAALTAHGMDPAAAQIAHSGVEIEGWHALAVLGAALWSPRGGRLANLAAGAFVLGTLLFCTAVCSLALGGPSLGPAAPAGGFILMAGWLLLAASAVRPVRR